MPNDRMTYLQQEEEQKQPVNWWIFGISFFICPPVAWIYLLYKKPHLWGIYVIVIGLIIALVMQ